MVRRYINISRDAVDGTNNDIYLCDECIRDLADDGRIWWYAGGIPAGFAIAGEQFEHLVDAEGERCEELHVSEDSMEVEDYA